MRAPVSWRGGSEDGRFRGGQFGDGWRCGGASSGRGDWVDWLHHDGNGIRSERRSRERDAGHSPDDGGEREVWEGKVVAETAPERPEAPGVRQCRHVKENGFRCRSTPAAGEEFCHQHRRYRRTCEGREI